jgi:hypothetical protein
MKTTANYYRHWRTYRPSTLTDLAETQGWLSFIVRTVLDKRLK